MIGAQYFNGGWGGNDGIDAQLPWEYNSPRDFGGHGTHTASTAAGNANVPTTGAAAVFGAVSGIAPRARIAAYKVCWQTATGGSCFSSDSVAAIDQAVADGVDVINFSISGSTTNFRDAVEIAFLYAADAGVFVAASAGNSGPTTSTVAHPGPWLTTVAAGTHNRNGAGSVTLGNSVTYTGASVATPVSAPLIDSTAAGLAGADPGQLALCYGATDGAVVLDPVKVAGKIVVCQRGVTARVNKSLAVLEAGGVGMILFNSPDSSLNADFHFVPTVHVNLADRHGDQSLCSHCGCHGEHQPGDDRLEHACPVHGIVLVARPAARRQRRPAEARPHRAGAGHPRRGRTSRERGSRLRPVQRHLDVEPARGGPGSPAQGPAPDVVADDDQVGADDHRLRRP